MEYDSAMKWNGVVIHATIWMNIEKKNDVKWKELFENLASPA